MCNIWQKHNKYQPEVCDCTAALRASSCLVFNFNAGVPRSVKENFNARSNSVFDTYAMSRGNFHSDEQGCCLQYLLANFNLQNKLTTNLILCLTLS